MYCSAIMGGIFSFLSMSDLNNCPRRVLAQRPEPEEALIGPPAYKECEILV